MSPLVLLMLAAAAAPRVRKGECVRVTVLVAPMLPENEWARVVAWLLQQYPERHGRRLNRAAQSFVWEGPSPRDVTPAPCCWWRPFEVPGVPGPLFRSDSYEACPGNV